MKTFLLRNKTSRIRTLSISNISFLKFLIILFFYVTISYQNVAGNNVTLDGISSQTSDDNSYKAQAHIVEKMSYGRANIGPVRLYTTKGTINKLRNDSIDAYSSASDLMIQYGFDGNFKSNGAEKWNISSDDSKIVNGINLNKKIQDGALIIRKSYDKIHWDFAMEPITNFFSNKKIDRTNLYSIPREDLLKGTYYEVTVAYKIEQKVGEKTGFLWIKTPKMAYSYCVEYYNFFVYYDGNPVVIRDINSYKNLNSGDNSQAGFLINKNGSSDVVTVKFKDNDPVPVSTLSTFTAPGEYSIVVTDPLGKNYSQVITVDRGLSFTDSLKPEVYANKKKEGYTTNTRTETGPGPHTSLVIGQLGEKPFTKVSSKFGVSGEGVYIFLRFNDSKSYQRLTAQPVNIGENCRECDPSILPENNAPTSNNFKIDTITSNVMSNTWQIVSDDYGKKDSEKIKDTYTGPVKTGALIIRTSRDGRTWNSIGKSHYKDELYTTDLEYYYGGKGDIPIYTPDGDDIINGIYIQVLYAYEVKSESLKKDLRIMEQYYIYLCSDNMDAVTFHNLSVGEDWNQGLEGYDEATAAGLKHTETLLSEAYTVSGFEIDNYLNSTVTYSLSKDGQNIKTQPNHQYTDTGKYIISLKNPVNTERTVVLYVDRMTDEEAFDFYFGESFIRGKRIYSEGKYPVYEGGKTSYYLKPVDEFHVPLGGYIKNLTTDKTINISPNRAGIKGDLSSPGEYIAVFNTNQKFDEDTESGDCREFTFHFRIIAEGTAPGPVVNKKTLNEKYVHTSITDAYPIYYGLIFPSSSTGNITLAFASREAAVQFAKENEKGMVEKQSDGNYRYIGSYRVEQKEKYESNWDLMDAIEYFAKEAVHTLYFDLSDEFTILSLSEDTIQKTENLRTLELNRSVVISADGQMPLLTNITALPIISLKPYQYLKPGLEGNIEKAYHDFVFVRDKYGCDSDSVIIIDSNGKEYPVQYNKGVGKQLLDAECPSGVVTIRESTIYGDTTEYPAVFIARNENTSTLTLSTIADGEEKQQVFTQADDNTEILVNAFIVSEIEDPLDPYNLIVVQNNQNLNQDKFFAADKIDHSVFADPGRYRISVVNRLGFGYTINIDVQEAEDIIISFSGAGTENLEDLHVDFGTTNVKLPYPTRYGYDFLGYEDVKGNLYNDEIAEILFRGSSVLNAVWKAKEFNLTLQSLDGKIIGSEVIKFGEPVPLPVPNSEDKNSDSIWMLDGYMLPENSFTLDSESDVTLVSIVKASYFAQQSESHPDLSETQVTSETTELNKEQTHSDSSSENTLMIGIGGGICVLTLVTAILYLSKKRTKADKNNSKTEPNTQSKSGKNGQN